MIAQVIITADDGGLCPEVNEAIIDLYENGCISRAALFASYGDCNDLCRALPTFARIPHVSLTFGRPKTALESIVQLLDSEGSFVRPEIDDNLSDALATHCDWIMNRTRAADVKAEVLAQCEEIAGDLSQNAEYTFHHNIDFFLAPQHYQPNEQILSRRDCVMTGVYADYRYLFLDMHEGEELAASRFVKMLEIAIEDSSAAQGAPVEVALHPATGLGGLSRLTSYGEERCVEFRAWKSKSVETILARGQRIGDRFVFD